MQIHARTAKVMTQNSFIAPHIPLGCPLESTPSPPPTLVTPDLCSLPTALLSPVNFLVVDSIPSVCGRAADTAPQLLDALFCVFPLLFFLVFGLSPFWVISTDQFSSSLILSCVQITAQPTKASLHFYYFFSLLIYYLTLFL